MNGLNGRCGGVRVNGGAIGAGIGAGSGVGTGYSTGPASHAQQENTKTTRWYETGTGRVCDVTGANSSNVFVAILREESANGRMNEDIIVISGEHWRRLASTAFLPCHRYVNVCPGAAVGPATYCYCLVNHETFYKATLCESRSGGLFYVFDTGREQDNGARMVVFKAGHGIAHPCCYVSRHLFVDEYRPVVKFADNSKFAADLIDACNNNRPGRVIRIPHEQCKQHLSRQFKPEFRLSDLLGIKVYTPYSNSHIMYLDLSSGQERCPERRKPDNVDSEAKDAASAPITQPAPAKRAGRNFGWALARLKGGKKVRRVGWNGKGMWVALQKVDNGSANTLPYLYIEYPNGHPAYPNGSRVPWVASQTDVLAEDWEVVE